MRRLLLTSAFAILAATALGQNDVSMRKVPRIDFQQIEVREALRQLFRMVGTPYTVAPEVQGKVTLSLRDVPFELALQATIRQVDATYRIEGWTYRIVLAPPFVSDPEEFFEEHREIDKEYERLATLKDPKPDAETLKWLGKRFTLYTAAGRPQTGVTALRSLVELAQSHAVPQTSVQTAEWSDRQKPGKERYASVAAFYGDWRVSTTPSYVDTWVRTPQGVWRLVERRPWSQRP